MKIEKEILYQCEFNQRELSVMIDALSDWLSAHTPDVNFYDEVEEMKKQLSNKW